ncbi:MAG TPA: thiamine pyrophosphate-binding protein [Rhodobacteraceae bacterium]|nr:thiamine pyrophosphate-binding protein [Paracoccaceae bacterium]
MSEPERPKSLTSADMIARRLYKAGCRHAFGIPGGEVVQLMDALERAGIKVTLVKHENCAGFMGEGVHHFDGAPAVLIATIGPGIANAANVIANATQDRVPLIALTGCVPALQQQTYTHQVFDHVKLAEPITKAAFRVDHGTAGVIADKAVAFATEGRPGAVLIDVPIDVQGADHDGVKDLPPRAPLAPMAPAASADLEQARQWFSQAQRPLMIAGVDVLNQNVSDAVAEFCHKQAIPLITTYKAKGVLPEDEPLALGGAGLSPKADKILLPLIDKADLIVLAGYDPIEMRASWSRPWQADKRVIEFSAVPNSHYMHQASLNFIGNVAAGLRALADGGNRPAASWPDGEIKRVRADLAEARGLDANWGPAAIVDECRKALPRNAIATVDSGAHRILLSQGWECYEPRALLQSTALCTMGCAVPLAMGRKLAEPDRPVVAFVGDAGLEMFLGELATARDLKLAIPIVVFVDRSLALIEMKQRGGQLPNLAVDFGATNFPAVGEALGGHGVWCDSRAELRGAMAQALKADRFTLIAARIDRKAYDGAF